MAGSLEAKVLESVIILRMELISKTDMELLMKSRTGDLAKLKEEVYNTHRPNGSPLL